MWYSTGDAVSIDARTTTNNGIEMKKYNFELSLANTYIKFPPSNWWDYSPLGNLGSDIWTYLYPKFPESPPWYHPSIQYNYGHIVKIASGSNILYYKVIAIKIKGVYPNEANGWQFLSEDVLHYHT